MKRGDICIIYFNYEFLCVRCRVHYTAYIVFLDVKIGKMKVYDCKFASNCYCFFKKYCSNGWGSKVSITDYNGSSGDKNLL